MAAFERAEGLRRLGSETFDVVVVGGGITGCGVALDAALRGLRVALVEADDFASGTSSKSSKLIHGGLRYLAQHDYHLVYEALAERQRLVVNAPHLVRPLPFLIPLFGRDGLVSESVAKAYSLALWTYDLTGGLRIGKRHRRIDAATARAHFPDLSAERLVAGFLYYDAQADDARLTLAVARSAATEGATVVNHAAVADLLPHGGKLTGVRLQNGTEVRSRVVVNAGGVYSDHLADLIATDPVGIRPAKGVHFTVPAGRLPCDYASVLTVPGDRRSVFVVPWVEGGFTYVGTTDTDYEGPLDAPRCSAEDLDYLLNAVNGWTTAKLTPHDVTGVWAGLRPLVRDASSARSADLSRRHRVTTSAGNVVTVTGGKLTTYRRMAADTVDEVMGLLQRQPEPLRRRTRHFALHGAEGTEALRAPGAAAGLGVEPTALQRLVGRYGGEARALVAMITAQPDLGHPLIEGLPYLRAEAVFAVRYEMATTLDDVLSRRTRAVILDAKAAIRAAHDIAALIGPELGWSDATQQLQVTDFVDRTQADLDAAGIGTPVFG
jgi:glycerol-3-phosphate dehydrogenase